MKPDTIKVTAEAMLAFVVLLLCAYFGWNYGVAAVFHLPLITWPETFALVAAFIVLRWLVKDLAPH